MLAAPASLPQLERFVLERNHEQSLAAALSILAAIDRAHGRLDGLTRGIDARLAHEDAALAFCTRLAAALGRMIADPQFNPSPLGYETLLLRHRWLDLIFSLSGFRGTDHLLPQLAGQAGASLSFSGSGMLRMLAIRSMGSATDLDFDQCWRANRTAAALAFLHYLDARTVFTQRGLEFRERLLEWLPDRIGEVELGPLTLSRVQEVSMHCSYAFTARKHAIKAGLVQQMRRACLAAGCRELEPGAGADSAPRPAVVVVIERFGRDHSVYRTHGPALRALKERFHVIWVSDPAQVGPEFQDWFDELIAIPRGDFFTGVRSLTEEIGRNAPALIFFVGVGMSAHAIALASLRLAPVQCVSFGHTATTMSPAVDYMILPEDFIGAAECFSEKLIALPKEAMPFAPPPIQVDPVAPDSGGRPVRVAVAASIMKLNARLFETLRRIADSASAAVEFHFMPFLATGIVHLELARTLRTILPTAVVHPHAPFRAYMESLRRCDLFLCPFPYGNMNGIVDVVSVGLPGVCLDGPEAHAHADAAFFARIGFPASLVAQTVDDYVAAATRLIDDPAWRADCRRIAVACDLERAFYRGDAGLFAAAIAGLIGSPAEARIP
jgi:hypothetical protein